MMQVKHGGCWYCESSEQPFLKSMQKVIINAKGERSEYAVAVCDGCSKAPILDQRVPVEQRAAR